MLIALFEPDIPQNTGSMIRLCACMNVPLHIIEPCGFNLDDKRMKRVSMDYSDLVSVVRHISWQAFLDAHPTKRLVLLSTHASQLLSDFTFEPEDILLFGRESSGVPDHVRDRADVRVRIPMRTGARSLNLAQSASMVLGEALRQTKGFPQ
jgi:tRNA (cytidine/uridine-2'-O-)-methyltransferase